MVLFCSLYYRKEDQEEAAVCLLRPHTNDLQMECLSFSWHDKAIQQEVRPPRLQRAVSLQDPVLQQESEQICRSQLHNLHILVAVNGHEVEPLAAQRRRHHRQQLFEQSAGCCQCYYRHLQETGRSIWPSYTSEWHAWDQLHLLDQESPLRAKPIHCMKCVRTTVLKHCIRTIEKKQLS